MNKYEEFLKAAEKARRIHEIFEGEKNEGMDFFVKCDSKMVKINLNELKTIVDIFTVPCFDMQTKAMVARLQS